MKKDVSSLQFKFRENNKQILEFSTVAAAEAKHLSLIGSQVVPASIVHLTYLHPMVGRWTLLPFWLLESGGRGLVQPWGEIQEPSLLNSLCPGALGPHPQLQAQEPLQLTNKLKILGKLGCPPFPAYPDLDGCPPVSLAVSPRLPVNGLDIQDMNTGPDPTGPSSICPVKWHF